MTEFVFSNLVDPFIGRKMAGMCRDCHLIDIGVKMETDRVFTVIGTIDTERRRNWEIQWSGAAAALQSSLAQKHSLTRLLRGSSPIRIGLIRRVIAHFTS